MIKNIREPIIGQTSDSVGDIKKRERIEKKQIKKEKLKQIWNILGEIIFGLEC